MSTHSKLTPDSEPPIAAHHEVSEPLTRWQHIRRWCYLALVALLADTASVMTEDVEQPVPLRSRTVSTRPLEGSEFVFWLSSADPDDDIQTIIDDLDSDGKYQAFLKEHSDHTLPKTPWTFLWTFAYSPEEFQDNDWEAPCNGYAEFACEVGERHGKNMYVLALWPDGSNEKPKNSVDDFKRRHSWHIVAFYLRYDRKTGTRNYVVFNNDTVTYLQPEITLAEWSASNGYEIIPGVGMKKWKRVPHDWRAELGRHIIQPNLIEDQIEPTVIGNSDLMLAGR